MFDAVGAAAEGAFISTNPHRCRCRTRRSAVILAMASAALWTRFLPSYCNAKDRLSAISSGVAGRRRDGSVIPRAYRVA
jgi:hypothetical protein